MQTFLIMVIIGGAGSFWGVVIAGFVMAALPEILRFSEDLRMIIYGAVLLVAMLALPGGVAGWFHARRTARVRVALR
jgi:ABC-type branched-subunit amino acid transport system permease subunit